MHRKNLVMCALIPSTQQMSGFQFRIQICCQNDSCSHCLVKLLSLPFGVGLNVCFVILVVGEGLGLIPSNQAHVAQHPLHQRALL